MYPYPSGDLHIGHWYAMTGPDIVARMHRMQGFNVMFPMGFDGFGLPAENAAIDRGIHPAKWTYQNIDTMRRQMRVMGASFDWTREVVTCDPEYYRWQQWLFLKLYEAGLAYKAMGAVDWCPKDQVVLAREQVVGPERRCWRCNTQVTKRDLEQWYFRITNYSDELLNFDGLDYPEPIKLMQTNWIGRSEGAEIDFPTEAVDAEPIRVFTTRPDTVYGATFMVLAPEHPLVSVLTTDDRKADVEAYVADARRETEIERMSTEREKTGVFIGAYAVNPMTERAHPDLDRRLRPARLRHRRHHGRPRPRRARLRVRDEVRPADPLRRGAGLGRAARRRGVRGAHRRRDPDRLRRVHRYAGDGGGGRNHPVPSRSAGRGRFAVTYRQRDWVAGRQRYWGAPIPIIYCDEHGAQPVPDDQLPVVLPLDVDFAPTGVSPLQSHAEFLQAECPVCGAAARRETDTMDTFVDSSWYFLRYCSPHDDDGPFDRAKVDEWLPIHFYTGGSEHAVMHLMYFRFFTKALRDLGLVGIDEPTLKLRNQGQILGADHNRMSKSRGNVQAPDELADRYGADTVRAFLMFIGPWDQGGPWNPSGIEGIHRWLGRVWGTAQPDRGSSRTVEVPGDPEEMERALRRATHTTIAAVSEDYEAFHFNTAISKLMELTNAVIRAREAGHGGHQAYADAVDTLLLLLAPVAPHIAEELWERRGHPYSVHQQPWPVADPALAASDTHRAAGAGRRQAARPAGRDRRHAAGGDRADGARLGARPALPGRTCADARHPGARQAGQRGDAEGLGTR